MKQSQLHYAFIKYKNYDEQIETFVSDHTNYEDALFDFVFQTLGYRIIKIQTEKDTNVQISEV